LESTEFCNELDCSDWHGRNGLAFIRTELRSARRQPVWKLRPSIEDLARDEDEERASEEEAKNVLKSKGLSDWFG